MGERSKPAAVMRRLSSVSACVLTGVVSCGSRVVRLPAGVRMYVVTAYFNHCMHGPVCSTASFTTTPSISTSS
jgi:hypothetical protein